MRKKTIAQMTKRGIVLTYIFVGGLSIGFHPADSLSPYPPPVSEQESKPLLRVWPVFRLDECDMALRPFVCRRCIDRGEQYAQKIYFGKEGLYREHGCYTDQTGFQVLPPGPY